MTIWFDSELHRLLQQRGQLPHALLIKGPQGIGKKDFGQSLAAALLCENPGPQGTACGNCSSCNWLASGAHPDFRVLSPATESDQEAEVEEGARKAKVSPWITIEQVRELHDFIHVSSHRGGRKVILICPAEALNVNAANALLKNLEEPPAHTHFILISHRPHHLPPTIISRCRQLSLGQPDPEVALEWLKAHGVAEPEVALAQCSGAPLRALAASEAGELQARRAFLTRIAPANFDPLQAAEILRDLPLEQFLSWLQRWTYDIASRRMLGSIRFNPDMATELDVLARQANPLAMLRLHRKLVRQQRHIHHPLNARLYIESALFAYAAVVNPALKAA
ncbi:MAG: DNA polymerase III subunit delta' [Burkholderiales bacterium]|nr:DNA polymerase III subunit delta' [Burkholderiales bacterium]